ncbi:GIY-YIG nuclease family protein [Cyclobacterium marinum]|uniref:GIY-YIG nuclease family protein n=1 Tax=Cyclobacterium marinum TaxID=104 RepID=UPI0011EC88D3|nr:GIY-YIG nuclease family protein [Cyclobacterium marinum]
MHCHFYILFSRCKNRYYIGATCDELKERVRRHNSNHKKGLLTPEFLFFLTLEG